MRLEPIDRTNWRIAGALRVAPGQLEMVAAHEPVGVLALIEEGATWTMRNLMIDARLQGRGHGRAVVLAAVEYARARGGEAMELTVHPFNAVAIRLYEAVGFSRSGQRGTERGMRLSLHS